jgi:flavin-dependent dehydrogenase
MNSRNGYVLEDGSRIGVIGGGPSGSFVAIFAQKMAKMVGKNISVTVFESKEFSRCGPVGCNHCGGVISELLVQALAVEGINIPESVLQRGVNAYRLHTVAGSVTIASPRLENTIATIQRGGGPLGLGAQAQTSFDGYLLGEAVRLGAVHQPVKIDKIEFRHGKPCLISQKQEFPDFDLVVGATGVKSPASQVLETSGIGYRRPASVTAGIVEILLEPSFIANSLGNAIQLFLLPVKDIKFAAMIPKANYVTMCILGKNLNADRVNSFLQHENVRKVLPRDWSGIPCCRCLPKMNVGAPKVPFTDRFVVCGDAGSTRLFKDGLGAAYLMGKSVAITAVFHGVSADHFRKHYYPVYRSLIVDNYFGRFLFGVTDIYKKFGVMTRAMLAVVRQEQADPDNPKWFSSILWNMFTGNERYKNIFCTAVNLPLHISIWSELAKIVIRSRPCKTSV